MSTGTAPTGVVIEEDHNDLRRSASAQAPAGRRSDTRLHGLDGIRGVAALFVVLHHCWLLSFPGYPSNTGPWWLGWLIYGHFAVVVFIVLSGFSLAIAPARSQWKLRSIGGFARRRAWRILPPYWAALAFSLAVAWWVVAQPGTPEPTAKSVVVHGFLVQDVAKGGRRDVRLVLHYDRIPSLLGLKSWLPDRFQQIFRFRRSSQRVVS